MVEVWATDLQHRGHLAAGKKCYLRSYPKPSESESAFSLAPQVILNTHLKFGKHRAKRWCRVPTIWDEVMLDHQGPESAHTSLEPFQVFRDLEMRLP